MHNLLNTLKWALICLVIVLWLGLCMANQDASTPFVLIPGAIEFQKVPLSVVLIFPLLAAFATFFLVGIIDQTDHFLTERELRKRIRDLEAEVSHLRNLPIRESLINQKVVEEENRQ